VSLYLHAGTVGNVWWELANAGGSPTARPAFRRQQSPQMGWLPFGAGVRTAVWALVLPPWFRPVARARYRHRRFPHARDGLPERPRPHAKEQRQTSRLREGPEHRQALQQSNETGVGMPR